MSTLPPPPPAMGPPPGYVAYGDPTAYGGHAKRVGGVGKALVVISFLVAAVSVVSLGVQAMLRDKAVDFRSGDISSDTFTDDLAPFLLVSLLAGGVAIAAFVLQCVWSYRLASNLRVLRRQPQSWAPGWGIGAWFLAPCTLNIVPYLMLRELWRGSDPQVAPGDPAWKRGPVGRLVDVWFWTGIVSIAIGLSIGVFGAMSFNRDNDDYAKLLDDQLPLLIVSGLLSAASTVVFALMVKALTERHVAATGER